MIYEKFYSELGKLLYAITDADGWITPVEKIKLQDIIKNKLVPTEKRLDKYGTDVAFYTEIEFDILDEEIANPEAAFESFINFIEKHHTAFDERIKKACVFLVNELASAYRGTNKKEQQLIDKLKKAFKKIEMKHRKGRSSSRKFMILTPSKKTTQF